MPAKAIVVTVPLVLCCVDAHHCRAWRDPGVRLRAVVVLLNVDAGSWPTVANELLTRLRDTRGRLPSTVPLPHVQLL
jgi:hypothetical protein